MKSDSPTSIDYLNWIGPRRYKGQVEITQEEWIGWWVGTGKWADRGRSSEEYMMFRLDKEKPFRLDNITCIQNKDKGFFGVRYRS